MKKIIYLHLFSLFLLLGNSYSMGSIVETGYEASVCFGDSAKLTVFRTGDVQYVQVYVQTTGGLVIYKDSIDVLGSINDTVGGVASIISLEADADYEIKAIDFQDNFVDDFTKTVLPSPSIVESQVTNIEFPSYFANNGQVEINATGGVGPYTFEFNGNVSSGGYVIGLSEGVYPLRVIDANGCEITKKVVLPSLPKLEVVGGYVPNTCPSQNIQFNYVYENTLTWDTLLLDYGIENGTIYTLEQEFELISSGTVVNTEEVLSTPFTSIVNTTGLSTAVLKLNITDANTQEVLATENNNNLSNEVEINLLGEPGIFTINSDTLCVSDQLNYELMNANLVGLIDFDVSTPSSNPIGSVTYPSPGTYNLTLEYETVGECPGVLTDIAIPITVLNATDYAANTPNPEITFYPEQVCPGDLVTIHLSQYSSNDITWKINGTALSAFDSLTEFTTIVPSNTSNTFNVEANIHSNCLTNDVTVSKTMIINLNQEVDSNLYSYSLTPNLLCANSPIIFSYDSSYYSDFTWNFGDGTTSAQTSGTYAYAVDGLYDVQLQITNGCGQTKTITEQVTVELTSQNLPASVFNFRSSASGLGSCISDQVIFTSDNYGRAYNIDYGDGFTESQQNLSENNVIFSHAYDSVGVYDVVLTIFQECGDPVDTTISVNIASTGIQPQVQGVMGSGLAWYQGDGAFSSQVESCDPVNFLSLVSGTYFEWEITPGNNFLSGPTLIEDTIPTAVTIFTNNGMGPQREITLTVTNGCGNTQQFTDSINITYSTCEEILTITDITQPTCDNPLGSAKVEAFSNTPISITYEWDDKELTVGPMIENVLPGEYHVTITKYNISPVIQRIDTVIIESPNTLVVDAQELNSASCLLTNGQATVETSGGTLPYNYLWSNGTKGVKTIQNVPAGIYTVTVTDGLGCEMFDVTEITNIQGPNVTFEATSPTCFGGSDGSISLMIANAGSYDYFWSTGSTDQNLTSVKAGKYQVSVTDENNCQFTGSYLLQQPSPVVVSADNITEPNCSMNNGSVTLSSTGGTPPYTYEWDNGLVGSSQSGLAAGYYSVVSSDANGCNSSIQLTLNEFPASSAKTFSKASSCGVNDGELASIVFTKQLGYTIDSARWIYSNQLFVDADNQDLPDVILSKPAGRQDIKIYGTETATQNSCVAYHKVMLPAKLASGVEICSATVNENDDNVVVFKPSDNPDIKLYNIYKEDYKSGEFDYLTTVNLDTDDNIYIDKAANADVKSHKYKISAVNSCGTESVLSAEHRTVHMTSFINLIDSMVTLKWERYRGGAGSDSIKIFYQTNATDTAGDSLTIISSNSTSYSFFLSQYPLVKQAYLGDSLDFYVQYQRLESCDFSLVKGKKEADGNSRGNRDGCCAPFLKGFACYLTSTADITGNCEGAIQVNILGGISPYDIVMDGDTFSDYISSLCAGSYQVNITDALGQTTSATTIVDGATALGSLTNTKLARVYPNPTNGLLYIDIQGQHMEQPIQVQIFNISGVLVREEVISSVNGVHELQLLNNMREGYYTLLLKSKNEKAVFKILKN